MTARYCEYPPLPARGCDAPKVTRHWKRLGEGATWTCPFCGRQYVLSSVRTYMGERHLEWKPRKEES